MLRNLALAILSFALSMQSIAGATMVGTMTDPRMPAVSGLAASHADPGLL